MKNSLPPAPKKSDVVRAVAGSVSAAAAGAIYAARDELTGDQIPLIVVLAIFALTVTALKGREQ